MFTAGNVDDYIDRYIGRHLIDIAVDSRSTVGQLSINYPSTGDREVVRLSIDSRPTVDRQSVKPLAEYQSIFRWCTSTEYRSYVDVKSVNCRWHISQMSVAYQSCVNSAGVTHYLLCQIYADPPLLGRQKGNDPPLNSSGPPPLLKNECSFRSSHGSVG